jgi:hypothetical protein
MRTRVAQGTEGSTDQNRGTWDPLYCPLIMGETLDDKLLVGWY